MSNNYPVKTHELHSHSFDSHYLERVQVSR